MVLSVKDELFGRDVSDSEVCCVLNGELQCSSVPDTDWRKCSAEDGSLLPLVIIFCGQ